MFLACVELTGSRAGRIIGGLPPRVVQLQFTDFETAQVWAREECSRRRDATGNAAVFESNGPFHRLAWECSAEALPSYECASFASDQVAARA